MSEHGITFCGHWPDEDKAALVDWLRDRGHLPTPPSSGWWAECDGLALERDGTVWALDGIDARPIGRIDEPGGLALSTRRWRAWESLAGEWRDAIDGN